MIYLDDRTGGPSNRAKSHDLAPLLPSALASVVRLPYGDAAFFGNGPGGTLLVGVEIKTLEDCLSSLVSGRLPGHQAPGMVRDYDVRYLIVQGSWKTDPHGVLQYRRGRDVTVGRKRFTFTDLHNWITTLESVAGFRIRRTLSRTETAATVLALYRWWNGKPFDKHKGHLAWDDVSVPKLITARAMPVTRKMAAQIDGIGWEKSAAVAKRFASVLEMACAGVGDWMEIEGIGKVLARRAVESLRGEP